VFNIGNYNAINMRDNTNLCEVFDKNTGKIERLKITAAVRNKT